MTQEEVAANMRCKLDFVQDNWPEAKPPPRLVPDTPEDVPTIPKKKKKKKK